METKDSLKALEKGLVVLETIKEAEQPLSLIHILNFRKAIWMPYMGTYLNRMMIAIGASVKR